MFPISRPFYEVGTDIPSSFLLDYNNNLKEIYKNNRGFEVFADPYYDIGLHPYTYIDFECAFASSHLAKNSSIRNILDIGSYRYFILGLLAKYKVTTVDIRDRKKTLDNETIMSCDAKKIEGPSNFFDAIISLCTLEHIGLGRYGDDFDLDGDSKAFQEMVRVLKPRGILIFTTTITQGKPSIVFNAHRIYNYQMIKNFCGNLEPIEEQFYSQEKALACKKTEITDKPSAWDMYCGCWKKP